MSTTQNRASSSKYDISYKNERVCITAKDSHKIKIIKVAGTNFNGVKKGRYGGYLMNLTLDKSSAAALRLLFGELKRFHRKNGLKDFAEYHIDGDDGMVIFVKVDEDTANELKLLEIKKGKFDVKAAIYISAYNPQYKISWKLHSATFNKLEECTRMDPEFEIYEL